MDSLEIWTSQKVSQTGIKGKASMMEHFFAKKLKLNLIKLSKPVDLQEI